MPHIKGKILLIKAGTLERARPSIRSREGMGVSSSCAAIQKEGKCIKHKFSSIREGSLDKMLLPLNKNIQNLFI
jgi:hypothetical protein